MEIDELEDTKRVSNSVFATEQATDPLHINDMKPEEAELIRKTLAQMANIGAPIPSQIDKPLTGRVSVGAPTSATLNRIDSALADHLVELEEVEADLQNKGSAIKDFPNLAWESIQAGLIKEQITNDQINAHVKEAENIQKDIDLLLELSAELTALKEGEAPTEKMKEILDQLKIRDIDLWKRDLSEMNKEEISEMKSLSSAQVDKLRSNLQIIFTTKVQVLIQSIGSIMEILKDIIRNNSRLINAANRLPGH